MAVRGDTPTRSRRWIYFVIGLAILGLGVVAVLPRASRLFLIGTLPESERQGLSARGISIDALSLSEIPDALLAPTGPEAIQSMLVDRGAGVSQIHLARVEMAKTSLYPAWGGLAYVATPLASQGAGYELLVVSAADGSLVLDLTFSTASDAG